MGISKFTGEQAMDMGITEAAVRQAESNAERSEALNPQYYADSAYAVDVAHAEALELNAQVVY